MRRWVVVMLVIALLSVPVRAGESKLIALTFDDGPGASTLRLLDGLRERNAKATFFVLGCNAEKYPETVQQAYREGHQIGNHTYDHNLLTKDSPDQILQQLKQTEKILNEICGEQKDYLFRPPFGAYSEQVLRVVNAPVVSWTIDPLDWKVLDAQKVADCVVEQAFDGAIVLSHDIYDTTVDGILLAMDRLQKEGYEFVTVSELFRRRGVNMKKGKVYNKCRPTGIELPS